MTSTKARILGEMDHSNVMKIHRLYTSDPTYYYMVLELMAGGELLDRIVQKVGRGAAACSR